MSTLSDRLDVKISLPYPHPCYKHWINKDTVLVLVLTAETQSYRPVVYDLELSTYSDWPPGQEHGILARAVPLRFFGTDGRLQSEEVMHMPPILLRSPDLKRVLWMNQNEEWEVANIQDHSAVRRPRSDMWLGSRQPIWFADSIHWAEPRISVSGKSYSEMDVYSTDHQNVMLHPIRGIRSGTFAGTTPGNELIIVALRPEPYKKSLMNRRQYQITRIDLNIQPFKRQRYTCALPEHLQMSKVRLSPNGRLLAWILEREDEFRTQASLWLSDLNGHNMISLGNIDDLDLSPEATLPSIGPSGPYDLEWDPDGTRLSFVVSNTIYRINAVETWT